MKFRHCLLPLTGLLLFLCVRLAHADDDDCRDKRQPQISFVQFDSPNIDPTRPTPSVLKIKGKLSLPTRFEMRKRCNANDKFRAVLILHGSAGVDSRGEFYTQALNGAGIATLEIDMWEARDVVDLSSRPLLPLFTYPDAFSALAFLSAQPNIDPERIGVLGFSWGGVISLASAEKLYAGIFGGGRAFKAHVANYPVCYAFNNTHFPSPPFPPTPAAAGTQFLNLTGAPVLIQIGSEDNYDNGTAHCRALATGQSNVRVAEYLGASHAWDRLMVPGFVADPLGDEGSFFATGVVPIVNHIPDVDKAFESRNRIVKFFMNTL